MDFPVKLFIMFTVLFGIYKCDCITPIKNLTVPQPVYIRNNAFLAPNVNGVISINAGEAILMACPGENNFLASGNRTLSVDVAKSVCSSQTNNSTEFVFNRMKCARSPNFVVEKVPGRECFDQHSVFRIGYYVLDTFFPLYEACVDKILLTTSYVKHVIGPNVMHLQKSKRPAFQETHVFGKTKMNKVYRKENQKIRINSIYGEGMDERYIKKKEFLTRGHLAPRADFPLAFQQWPTFSLVNACPQWYRGNAGDWEALEDATRKRIRDLDKQVTIFTGTFGVITLKDKSDAVQEFYLHTDENGNNLVPVPLYFYKVIYDEEEKAAIVFVSINSPFYKMAELEKLSFCDDVCKQNDNLKWIKWRSNDDTHSFCCTFKDFNETIAHLGYLRVDKLFY